MIGVITLLPDAGALGSGVRNRMQAAGAGHKPVAVMRVCTYCMCVLGAKDGTTGQEIKLEDLKDCRMDLAGQNMVTGGTCPACFEELTGTKWPGEQT